MKQRRKTILALVAAVLAVVLLLWGAYRGFTEVTSGEHLETVDWLPSEASDVSYYRSYLFTAYEFDISEEGFLKWASDWEVKPVQAPYTIRRYSSALNRLPYPGDRDRRMSDPTDVEEFSEAMRAWEAEQRATITTGYWYERVQRNGGGVWVAYDRDRKRAYYVSTPR